MPYTGMIRLKLVNGQHYDTSGTKENFVALNSFLRTPMEKRKGKIKAGPRIVHLKEIVEATWIAKE